MKVAICFFGEIGFMDRFMIQNFIRCITTPIKRHDRSTEIYYFLHSYMSPDTLVFIETMRPFLPFSAISLHDKDMVIHDIKRGEHTDLFLEHYSLSRVKKLWRSSIPMDMIIYIRLDALFLKPLSENDIDLVVDNKNHLFITNNSPDLQQCFIMGDPFVMNIYADRVHYTDYDCMELMRSQYNIKINNSISIVFVRVLPGGIVHHKDHQICPYLNDLISSSCTKIHMIKRKHVRV